MCLLFCILYLVRVTQAAPTTNSPVIGDGSEAPSGANFRTLPSIVSTCALTIVARIYSAIHPNIPSPKDSPVLILLRRLGIMGIALLAPDLLVAWAMRQWLWAYHITAQFNLIVRHPRERSENNEYAGAPAKQPEGHDGTQALGVQAAGDPSGLAFLQQFYILAEPFMERFRTRFLEQSEDYTWTQTHSFFALMGGFMLYLISRAICHLETTQLEWGRSLLRFSISLPILCGGISLSIYYVLIQSTGSRSPSQSVSPKDDLVMPAEIVVVSLVDSMLRLIGVDAMSPRKLQVPTFDGIHSIKFKPWESNVLTLTGFAIATIFGSIHCTAWFYVFPTYQEQVIWRMSALAITFAPWLAYVAAFLLFRSRIEKRGSIWFTVLLLVFPAVYIAARAILFILMFTTLRNLPPDAYKAVPWTKLVPHL
ncbi:hypothetical protein EDB19DRAFT_1833413 [Suillus lakei]|nr:hypothetical protein EDB19DRAFT_1833413 [Suillus lakei]